MATTGKNSKKRVMEIRSILGKMFSVNMSLQSMSETVLANIKRANIRHEDMIAGVTDSDLDMEEVFKQAEQALEDEET